MLTEKDLQELLGYQARHTVLSIYLNTEPSQGSADAYRLRLRSMLKDVDLPDDVQAVEQYFSHEFDWSGRSVAVFSCAPEKFFRAYPLAVPVRERMRQGSQPYVKPLADLWDAYGGYGVVLVDKQGARLFFFHLGELREQEGVMGEAVRHTKRGGASAMPGRRGGVAGQTNYAEEVAERNMREAANFTMHFFAEKDIRRVLIGGTDDNVAQFRSMLPKTWQSLVVGTFAMGMSASADEVQARAMQIGQQAEARREELLVQKIVTGAAKGKGGVLNIEATLTAVHEGRVQTLVIQDGYRAPGYRCQGCGSVTALEMKVCPFCGAEFARIPDAVEMAVRKVMQDGGEVEVLHHATAAKGFDKIGGLLRY
jgi:peptide subunit release factor 1 (eRF1)